MEEGLAPHFNLPCRADGTSIDAAGYSRLLDEYFTERGYDLSLGWPQPDVLKTLGLDALLPELEALRESDNVVGLDRRR
jgi:hypothetical protein